MPAYALGHVVVHRVGSGVSVTHVSGHGDVGVHRVRVFCGVCVMGGCGVHRRCRR